MNDQEAKVRQQLQDKGYPASHIEAVVKSLNSPSAAPSAIPAKVEILLPLGALKAHPEYEGAKNGDAHMAKALISRIITDEAILSIAARVRETGASLLPVVGIEEHGGNMIPATFAAAVGFMAGVPVSEGVIRKTPDSRTHQDGMSRIFNTPVFEGEVEQGDRFYLIDDTITQGGTLAALSRYVAENGGQVVGAAALTGQQRSATLGITENTLLSIRKHFKEIENDFKTVTGRDFTALTESEAHYLLRPHLVQRFRDETAARSATQKLGDPAGLGGRTWKEDRPTANVNRSVPDTGLSR